MQNLRPLFITVSPVIVMGTSSEIKMYIYAYDKLFEGIEIMAPEKVR